MPRLKIVRPNGQVEYVELTDNHEWVSNDITEDHELWIEDPETGTEYYAGLCEESPSMIDNKNATHMYIITPDGRKFYVMKKIEPETPYIPDKQIVELPFGTYRDISYSIERSVIIKVPKEAKILEIRLQSKRSKFIKVLGGGRIFIVIDPPEPDVGRPFVVMSIGDGEEKFFKIYADVVKSVGTSDNINKMTPDYDLT